MTGGGVRLVLRLAVATVLLVLAFRLALPEGQESIAEALASAWTSSLPVALGWFGVAAGLFGLSFGAAARRFEILLSAAGLAPRFLPVLRAYVVANFLTLVLPSAIVSDAYRVVDAKQDSGTSAEPLAVLAAERVLSLAALGVVVLVAVPFAPLADTDRARVLLALAAVGTIVGAGLALLRPRYHGLLRWLLSPFVKLSTRLAAGIDAALAAASELSKRPGILARAFAWSVIAQLLPVCAVAALAQPLDTDLGLHWYFVAVPFIFLIALIPISLGGAGVREWLFIEFFGALGMRSEVALSLSLSAFAVSLAWGFVGLALFAWGRRKPSRPAPGNPTP